MIIISEILRYIIIISGFILGVVNTLDAIKQSYKRRVSDALWSKWAYAFLGFYWCIVYIVLIFIPIDAQYEFTSSWIKPSLSFLIILLLIGKQRSVYLPDIIKDIIKRIKEKRGRLLNGKY